MSSSATYIDYYRFSEKSFHERIRYFEKHVLEINSLGLNEKVEIMYDYLGCLFEIGRYRKYLEHVDPLIEMVIVENVYELEGKDVYRELLTRKAASSYNIGKYEQADHILISLMKIYPDDPFFRAFFRKNVRKLGKYWYRRNKSLVVLGVLLATSILQVQMLAIDPFYSHLSVGFTWSWKFLFAVSAVAFGYNEWKIWYLSKVKE